MGYFTWDLLHPIDSVTIFSSSSVIEKPVKQVWTQVTWPVVTHLIMFIALWYHSLVPRPPHPAFVACNTKSGGKAWKDLSHDACHCWCHIQSAHIWACSLPFTILSQNSVRSFCSVCPVSPIATGLIVASCSTWRQQRHKSRDKSFQAFPPLFILQATKAGHGGLGARLTASLPILCLGAVIESEY